MQEAAPLGQRSRKRSIAAELRGKHSWRGAALWVTLGIVGGAICWQAGLPGLVAGLVRDPSGAVRDQSYAGNPIETGSLPSLHRVEQKRCTNLALDRSANRTVVGHCPEEGLVLRLEGDSDRGDLPRLAGNEAR